MINRQLLTIQEVAEMRGVHTNTVRVALHRNRLFGEKVGRQWLIPIWAAKGWKVGERRGKAFGES